jgi:hypothetical protein
VYQAQIAALHIRVLRLLSRQTRLGLIGNLRLASRDDTGLMQPILQSDRKLHGFRTA